MRIKQLINLSKITEELQADTVDIAVHPGIGSQLVYCHVLMQPEVEPIVQAALETAYRLMKIDDVQGFSRLLVWAVAPAVLSHLAVELKLDVLVNKGEDPLSEIFSLAPDWQECDGDCWNCDKRPDWQRIATQDPARRGLNLLINPGLGFTAPATATTKPFPVDFGLDGKSWFKLYRFDLNRPEE